MQKLNQLHNTAQLNQYGCNHGNLHSNKNKQTKKTQSMKVTAGPDNVVCSTHWLSFHHTYQVWQIA